MLLIVKLYIKVHVEVKVDSYIEILRSNLVFCNNHQCSDDLRLKHLEDFWTLQLNQSATNWKRIRVLRALLSAGPGCGSTVRVAVMDGGCAVFRVRGLL